jgi:beta-glucanase (GH16 family)
MSTNLTPPAGYTSDELVFNDSFQGSSLNSSYWNTYMSSAASGGWAWFPNGSGGSAIAPAGSYDAEYMQASHVSVNNGLTLSATNQSTESGYAYTSGLISSYDKVEFDGGYLQVSMKEPAGDGSWPGIWLLPGAASGQKTDNAEIDVQEGGFTGSGNPNDVVANHLLETSSKWGKVTNVGTDLTAGYNTYAIDWVPGQSITWYLNGKETEQITSAQANIPNEPMELIISQGVAGPSASGWHTVTDQNTPSNMAMMVNDIQLYQTPSDILYLAGNLTPPMTPITSPGGTTSSNGPPPSDFNGDGYSDILWQNTSGQPGIWEMNGTNVINEGNVGANPGPSWKAIGTGDFNGDGHSAILWQNTNGQAAIWEMNGTNPINEANVGANPGQSWQLVGTGDFNGDGKSDLLWQNTNGQAAIWEMNGTNVISEANVGANPGPSWKVIGTGDFNGDGKSDILWQNTSGQASIWEMNGTNVISEANVGANPGQSWHVKA